MTSGVYIIRNLVNGMIYIGSSVNIERRWKEHTRRLTSGTHYNPHLQKAWNEYKVDNFVFEIVEICTRDGVAEREQRWLDAHLPTGNCYNIATGVQHSFSCPQRSPEHRRRLSEANKGKSKSPETIRKLSEARSGKKLKPRSHETRQRISGANLKYSKWYEFTHPNGDVSVVQGLSPFCREHNLNLGNVCGVSLGKRTHDKGFKCRVLSDEEVRTYLDSINQNLQKDKEGFQS